MSVEKTKPEPASLGSEPADPKPASHPSRRGERSIAICSDLGRTPGGSPGASQPIGGHFRYLTDPETRERIRRHVLAGDPLDNASAVLLLADLTTALAERSHLLHWHARRDLDDAKIDESTRRLAQTFARRDETIQDLRAQVESLDAQVTALEERLRSLGETP